MIKSASLILVKHSLPKKDFAVPAAQWRLAEEGRRRCLSLARHLAHYSLEHLFSSPELKAVQTTQLTAAELGLAWETRSDLHEHLRATAGFFSPDEFHASIQRLFNQPHELVFGEETAAQAENRFTNAVTGILEQYPLKRLAIVAHGTVISLFTAKVCHLDPFLLWMRLGLPSLVVLSLPRFKLETILEEVEPPGPLLR